MPAIERFLGCFRGWRIQLVLFPLAVGVLLLPTRALGDSQRLREYDLKAALLFNLVKYVDWRAEAFATRDDPIVIGILGNDPFGEVLDTIVRGRRVNGRPISIRRAGGLNELKGAHLVFISPSESHHVAQLCDTLESFGALTTGDMDQGAAFTAVSFGLEEDRIVFAVDLGRAKRAGVRISSHILRLAKIVVKPAERDIE
jgi:hypothetical protein